MASGVQLRFRLSTGDWTLPLLGIEALSACAAMKGSADDYFLGWLNFHGEPVPVFDLDRVANEHPTRPEYGSRIVIVRSNDRRMGLLVNGATDTTNAEDARAFDLEPLLPMLATLTPAAVTDE